MVAALRLFVTQSGHRDRALLRLPEIKLSEFHFKCGSWSLAFVLGKVEWQPLSNLLFAIAGFAGGLITAKQTKQT